MEKKVWNNLSNVQKREVVKKDHEALNKGNIYMCIRHKNEYIQNRINLAIPFETEIAVIKDELRLVLIPTYAGPIIKSKATMEALEADLLPIILPSDIVIEIIS